jgi:hypothetical protein
MPLPHRLRPEPLLNAVAAIAVGMFIGCWVIGPALTYKSDATPQGTTKATSMTFEAMLARPDPFPYRTATPVFDSLYQTHYAEAAREKARAEIGSRTAASPWSEFQTEPIQSPNHARWHYRAPDRHAVY